MSPQSSSEWWQNGRLSSYVTEMRIADGVLVAMETAQPAGDMSDPPVSDLVLIRGMSGDLSQHSDLGAGRFRSTTGPGALFLIPPGIASSIDVHVPHRIRGFALSVARFGPTLAEVRPSGDPFDFGPLHAAPFASPAILNLTDRLWAQAGSGGASRLLAESVGLAILAELDVLSSARRQPARGGLAPWAERRCREYLRAHVAEDVALDDLAALANLSPFHFARAFKTSLGLPPHAYLRRLRAEAAKEMLRRSDLSITEISGAVGYETPQAFARMFRAETGTSPTAWRREVRG